MYSPKTYYKSKDERKNLGSSALQCRGQINRTMGEREKARESKNRERESSLRRQGHLLRCGMQLYDRLFLKPD